MRRVLVLLAAALGLTMLPITGGTPTASAAPSDIVAVVVDGVGNGHGRGMSQWGAYGWAVDQSKSWQWILDHYYGGTTLGNVNTDQARIRVRLLGLDNLATVGVTSGSGNVTGGGVTARSLYAREVSQNQFAIYRADTMACPATETLVVPNGPIARGSTNATAVRQIQTFLNSFRVSGDITLSVDGDFGPLTESRLRDWQGDQNLTVDGIWNSEDATRARAQIDGSSGSVNWSLVRTVTGPVNFTSSNGDNSSVSPSSVLGVCSSSGRVTHYRGKIEVRSEGDGNRVVNDVKTEDYLRGVVPKEISASWADAGGGKGTNAVRAQAVAARSYALQQSRYGYASICDTQSCQVYAGSAIRTSASAAAVNVEDSRTDAAIVATAGKVRKFADGQVASTEFSASNGPRTAGGAFPPVDDALGDGTSGNPNHRWTRVLDADALASKYGLGTLTGASMVEAESTVNGQFDGIWFNDVILTGTAGSRRIPAWTFRGENWLPSPGFELRVVTRDAVGAKVALIGDSVGESAENELSTLTDGTFTSLTIDTLSSRFITKTPPSPSGVQAAAGLPTGLDLAIVELGYNPSTDMAADIDQMMSTLKGRGVKRVIWVNMAELRRTTSGSSYYASANAALRDALGRWPDLAIADWNAASAAAGAERARWFTSDGVHLTATGQAQFGVWLRQIAGASAPGGGSTVVVPATSGRFQPNQQIELQVVGASVKGTDGSSRTIPAGVSAVALNITAVTPATPGFVTVWPCDVARPDASNLNYVAGGAVANSVIASVGASGKVCFFSNQATDFLVDITGWFAGEVGGSETFVGATPRRVVDTRNGIGGPKVRIPSGGTISIPLAGAAMRRSDGSAVSIPADATAVAMNVTAVLPSQAGFFTVWPCGSPMPVASNVNFTGGSVVANGVVTSLGADGSVCLYSDQESDVLVDVLGWFGGGSTPPFTGAIPSRLVDTRNGVGGPAGVVTPAGPRAVPVRGVTVRVDGVERQVPNDAAAVALNVTMVEAQAAGFATVWPCGTPMPDASNVNFGQGGTAANGVIAPIGGDGSVCIFTSANAHLIVDISGWFTGGASPAFVGNIPKRLVDTRNSIGPTPR
jgi:peptidoglycan hydrolase-like protein with peptidoglycan-binding domain